MSSTSGWCSCWPTWVTGKFCPRISFLTIFSILLGPNRVVKASTRISLSICSILKRQTIIFSRLQQNKDWIDRLKRCTQLFLPFSPRLCFFDCLFDHLRHHLVAQKSSIISASHFKTNPLLTRNSPPPATPNKILLKCTPCEFLSGTGGPTLIQNFHRDAIHRNYAKPRLQITRLAYGKAKPIPDSLDLCFRKIKPCFCIERAAIKRQR